MSPSATLDVGEQLGGDVALAGREGDEPVHRPLRGRARHDPPRPHRAPDRPAADRVLAVDPWPGGRAARFTPGNFEKNLQIVDEVTAVVAELEATSAQVALAWLLAQGDD